MSLWNPLFSKVVQSSLWVEPYHVRLLFLTMLAVKDRDHVVRHSDFALHRLANITQAETQEALKILSSPDTRRQDVQEFDGRRIQKVADGWTILNGEKYQQMISAEARRARQRAYQQSLRNARKAREKSDDSHIDIQGEDA